MKKLRTIELFAGIGSQKKALYNSKIEHEVVGISEWNINSIIAYDKLHTDDGADYSNELKKMDIINKLKGFTFSNDGETVYDISKLNMEKLRMLYNANIRTKNLGSILDLKRLPVCDLLTYSFPCQDISFAGKGEGIKQGTRSGLLFEVERLLDTYEDKPKFLLMENVSNLLSKKHILNFEKWCKKLETLGYNNYYQILSSSDYGIPQERKRVFMVSVLNEDSVFVFPKKRELTKCVLDFIEKDRAHKVNKTLLPYYNKKYHEKYTSKNGLIKIFDGEKQGFFKSDFTNKRIYSGHGTCPTITKNNKINIYELNGVVNGNEALLLMGFDKTDVNKLNFLSDNQKYSLAGNSIVVNVLEDLFKEIVKFKW